MTEIKTARVLNFEPGVLEIYGEGHGDKEGSGCLTFNEDDVEWEPSNYGSGGVIRVKLSRSELLEIAQHISQNVNT